LHVALVIPYLLERLALSMKARYFAAFITLSKVPQHVARTIEGWTATIKVKKGMRTSASPKPNAAPRNMARNKKSKIQAASIGTLRVPDRLSFS